jgi:CHAT domain-containing protein
MVVDYYVIYQQAEDGTSRARYAAVLLNRLGLVASVDLGPAESIEHSILLYRQYLGEPRTAGAKEVDEASRNVYRAAWQPLDDYVRTAGTIFICPDGDLNVISFAGLPDENGVYLIEKHPLQYLSCTRDLLRLAGEERHLGKGIMLIGNPDYGGRFPSLPQAEREIVNVAEAWKAVFTEPVKMLSGVQAAEREFRASYAGKRVLYFAAHSAESISAPEGTAVEEAEAVSNILPNGIVLAEFRGLENDSLPDQDGLLTAEEISGLNLEGTELAVLSICESGGGRLVSGEGVYGLRRAFQMAGVRTVISTLWPVDDFSTAELMKHGLFDSTATYPEILQRACLRRITEIRNSGALPNPFLWAAFVCTGDWRT